MHFKFAPIRRAPGTAKLTAALLMVIGVAVALPAHGQDYVKRGIPERQDGAWVEQDECKVPVRDGSRLILRTDVGSINVSAGASGQVECLAILRAYTSDERQARRLLDAYHYTVESLPDGGALVRLKGQETGRRRERIGVKLSLTVPTAINLELETSGGNISIHDPIHGGVRAETAGGDVDTSDVGGRATVITAGGNITLGNADGPAELRTAGGNIRAGNINGDATLESSGGDIEAGQVDGAARAETAGGDIQLMGVARSAKVETAGGQIRIGDAGGDLQAETAGGSILVKGARGLVNVQSAGGSINLFGLAAAVRAETAAGRIFAQLAATGKSFGASKLVTSSGDVVVFIPPDLPLTIDAAIESAGGNKIVSDFPLTIRGGEHDFISRPVRAEGPVNGGGETLTIRTMDGGIEIRKVDAQTIEQLKQRENEFWKPWRDRRSPPPPPNAPPPPKPPEGDEG
jgi:putative adhesin